MGLAVSDLILRTALIWVGLLLLLRASGRRTMGEMSPTDFIVLLIVGDVVTQALNSSDRSLTGAMVVVVTLLLLNVLYAYAGRLLPGMTRSVEGTPTLLVRDGCTIERNLAQSRITKDDILAAARREGIADLSEVRYAVLEVDGIISIIPRADPVPAGPQALPR